MNVHTLSEYESRELRLDAATVTYLSQRHRRHLELRPLDRRDVWEVRATSMVGTVNAGTDVFHIRPKARLANLLAMMDVEIPSETWHREVAMLDDDPDLLGVMARLFCVACEHATARGIRRAYQERTERLVSPRGRIDVAQIVRQAGLPAPVPCRFDEHTADVPLNQLVKQAVEVARRVPGLSPKWRYRLRAQLAEFAEVTTPLWDIGWVSGWQPNAMERHYATAARLAYLILNSMSLRDQAGSRASNAFLLNMNDLFEKWVTARLKAHCRTTQVVAQRHVTLGAAGEIPMNPDVTFWAGRQPVGVADCKYKLIHDGDGRSDDYYQALAYATSLGLGEATLIYARFPGDPEGTSVRVRGGRCVLHTVGLDLTGPLDAADAVLREQARKFERSISELVAPTGGT